MPVGERGASSFDNPMHGMFGAVSEYMIDAAQRSAIYCDVMRQRGNAYLEQGAKDVPHVLHRRPADRSAIQAGPSGNGHCVETDRSFDHVVDVLQRISDGAQIDVAARW